MMTDSAQQRMQPSQLTAVDRHQLLVTWNDTKRDYPIDKCLHQLFEEQVERTPEAIAVVFEEQQLTYRQLNARANQLAHHLQTRGVGPEVLVGIYAHRSLELLVGLLGILKAGGAYVPLDPTYPKERLRFMLNNTQAPVLLTQHRLIESLSAHGAHVICLDQHWKHITHHSTENIDNNVSPENLAYVLYTSGSTGTPKGAMNLHRGLCNRLLWMQDTYRLTQADRVLQKTPLSFDVSGWEFFWPLLVGARVIMAQPEGHRDAAYLVKVIAEQRITVLHFVPSMLQVFLDVPGVAGCKSLRMVMCGGERLSYTLQQRFFAHLSADLHNLYGPTEASIDVTSWICQQESDQHIVPIGRPIANTQIYLLDSELQPVPVGTPGELYISGIGLGRGYLHDPEQTAENFIPNPFNDAPGSRLYKTGDLARYFPDGNIEFIGRIDHQVKIRGVRVELGEIEAALAQHPAVRDTVVVAQEDSRSEMRLVAYLVADPALRTSVGDLRSFLKQKLPEPLVPFAFVTLDAFPLMPNGKVDRSALPAPDWTQPVREEVFVAPRTVTERQLAVIWAEVLGVAPVGAHDDFFVLGGHSLSATLVLVRIRERCGVELSHRTIFETPILSALATQIDNSPPASSTPEVLFSENAPSCQFEALSAGQTEIWFNHQLEPSVPIYNDPFTIYMQEPVDSAALELALNEIIRRHEILRTAFVSQDGCPVQCVQDEAIVNLTVTDLNSLVEIERERIALQQATAEARRPFDLSQPPLLRATLVRMNTTDCRLYLIVHHIVSDAYSVYYVLISELWQLYQSIRTQAPSPLQPLPVQYVDYARWQRQWLQSESAEKHLTYWKKQLEGVIPLQLPTDRPHSSMRTFRGRFQSLALPEELVNELKTLSRRERVTLYMVLLAAFKAVLWRYSQQPEIVVGTVEAGRDRSQWGPLFGYFLNILVLRTQVADDLTFRQLLQRVRDVALDAYAYRRLPFSTLLEALGAKREHSHHPLFQVAFVMEPPLEAHESGWLVSQLDVQTGAAKFDLTVELEERAGGIIGRFEYNADLFDDATIIRMIGHFTILLQSVSTDPEQRISALPLLTETEKHQLLVEWNNTESDYPKDRCVPELFAAQVERTPDAIALVAEDQRYSYRELNERANQLAHYLQKQQVGPHARVAIYMDRSLDLIVGLVGILKTGAAYVPLDPRYPAEQLRFILEDTQAKIVISQERLLATNTKEQSTLSTVLCNYHCQVVCLDSDWQEIAKESLDNLDDKGTANLCAYVVYTSGSTGKPKGVEVAHRGIVRLLFETDYAEFGSDHTFMHAAPTAFDASTFEIWGALLHGSTCVLYSSRHPTPENFGEQLTKHRVTTLWLTASLYNLVIDEAPWALLGVKQLLIGGEALSVTHVRKGLEFLPQTQIINGYGPTESTTFACCYRIPRTLDAQCDSVPIGKPIGNTTVYILDSERNPVPVGVAGELYIGGDGLALGYLNDPLLTAAKFSTHSFDSEPPQRLYRTGDRARYLPDGNIEFLGRIDNQVKLRGFRIELGAIESVLRQHPAIRDAIVLVREDRPEDKRLVAHLLSQSQPPTVSELRSFLQSKLPDYMLPAAFVFLDTLPLMSTGKIDRQALPAPLPTRPELDPCFVAPRTPVEKVIAEIWRDVLGLESVGIHDNFFALGGHSLLATQVIARINNQLHVTTSIRFMFRFQTIAALATYIDKHRQRLVSNETLDGLLSTLEAMSDEDAEHLLSAETSRRSMRKRDE
jgi:amino acid adenylation domain-containing protein